METRIYEVDGKEQGKLKALLEKDPYAKPGFATQGYKLKEGRGIGGEAGKYYLCIRGEPTFFSWAEEKFKGVPSAEGQEPVAPVPGLKRTEKVLEAKIIAAIEAEENAAEVGMGSIFG